MSHAGAVERIAHLERRLEQMGALEAMGRAMQASLGPDAVVAAAVRGVAEIFEPELVVVWLGEGARLRVGGLWSGPEVPEAQVKALRAVAERLSREAVETGEARDVEELRGGASGSAKGVSVPGALGAVALPLVTEGKTLGALALVKGEFWAWRDQVDLLERAAAQLAVRLPAAMSVDHLRSSLCMLSDLILEVDGDGVIRYCHCELPRLLRCDGELAAGKRVREVFAEEVVGKVTECLSDVRHGTAPMKTICSLVLDEQPVWMEVHVITGPGGPGSAPACTLHARDISDFMHTEEVRHLLSTAVEQSSDGVLITEIDGTIRYANAAFERISGYTRDQVIGATPRLLKSGKHDEAFYRRLWRTLMRGEVWTGHFVNKRADGTLYEEDAAIYPICDARDAVVNFVAVKRDVTEAIKLERRTLQARKMEAVGTFASRMAHDFNNLLTVIRGTLAVLSQRAGTDEDLARRLAVIDRATADGARLTSSLLAFARRQVLDLKEADLNEEVSAAVPLLERLVPERVSIRLDLVPRRLHVRCDRTLFKQVLFNLCSNAADAMPGGGEILLSTGSVDIDADYVTDRAWAQEGEYVFVSIRDEGEGMDEQTLARILDPFFTTKQPGKGTGLGLASAYGTVKQHQGMIEISSALGVGTTVVVYLPVATASGAAPGPVATEAVAPARARGEGTILVVEDHDDLRSVMAAFLRSLGYEVLEASDGVHAVEMLESGTDIVLVVTDVAMPRMDGGELYRRARKLAPQLLFLFCTGRTEEWEKIACHADPRVAHMEKPFDIEELGDMVRSVLERVRRSTREHHD